MSFTGIHNLPDFRYVFSFMIYESFQLLCAEMCFILCSFLFFHFFRHCYYLCFFSLLALSLPLSLKLQLILKYDFSKKLLSVLFLYIRIRDVASNDLSTLAWTKHIIIYLIHGCCSCCCQQQKQQRHDGCRRPHHHLQNFISRSKIK